MLRNSNVGVAKTIVLYDKTDKENYGFNGMDGLDPARNRLDSWQDTDVDSLCRGAEAPAGTAGGAFA